MSSRRVFGLLNRLNHLVDVIESLLQAQQNMLALFRFAEVKARPASHNLLAVTDKRLQNTLQGKQARHAINQRQHIVMEGGLKSGVLVEQIENLLRLTAGLKINHHPDVAG